MVNIVYCFDRGYQQHFGASVTSLLLNFEGDAANLSIFIVTDECDSMFLKKINHFENCFKASFKIIQLNENSLNQAAEIHAKVRENSHQVDHVSSPTWWRIFLAEYLPGNIDKLLYLDADTIILSSIDTLFNIDLKGAPIGGVKDFSSEQMKKKLDLDYYINSGVLLIDLKQWRKLSYTDGCISWAMENWNRLTYVDQCAINGFFKGKIEYLPPTWNQFITCKNRSHQNINQGILHFITKDKPWQSWYENALASKYWDYLKLSPCGHNCEADRPKTFNQARQLARLHYTNGNLVNSISEYDKLFTAPIMPKLT